MITISLIAAMSIIPLSLSLDTSSKILLVILAVISIAYNLPLFSIQDKKFGIRHIPGIKLFLIASVWALSCVLLPILELGSHKVTVVTLNDTILLIVNRFLFIAAIAVTFDVRDLYQDKFYELKTIPVLFGEKWSLLICQGFLGAYLIILLILNDQFDANFIGLSLTIVLCGWFIFKSKWKKNEYYYFLFLDGILILQYLILILFGSITL
jgi:4-hydroxybenzoate polyprenyltransferase